MKSVTRALRASAHQKADQTAALLVFARDTASGFMTTAHHTVMILGIGAIAALAFMFVNPDVADHLKALSPFHTAPSEPAPNMPSLANLMTSAPMLDMLEDEIKTTAASEPEQKRVTSWLSKRYRVAGDATDMLVAAAYETARETRLDPLLILAVMAIESGFNPFAESPMGAQGLMQVMSKVHVEKFEDLGGVKAALNPVANIRVGSLILRDYVTRGGSLEAGLKLYVGAAAFENDSGYGARVLAEYQRLKDVSVGKRVPLFTPQIPAQTQNETPKSPEQNLGLVEVASTSQVAAL